MVSVLGHHTERKTEGLFEVEEEIGAYRSLACWKRRHQILPRRRVRSNDGSRSDD